MDFDPLKMAIKYSPELRFHPEEQYYTLPVPTFLKYVSLRVTWKNMPETIVAPGRLTLQSLLGHKKGKMRSGAGPKSLFFLDIPRGEKGDRVRLGDLDSSACYFNIQKAPTQKPYFDIKYLFFYAYNGRMSGIAGEHEGDWEHITIRITEDASAIHRIYYSAHYGEGQWYKENSAKKQPNGYMINDSGHPIVYSALDGHSSYPFPTRWYRGGVKPDDVTENGGKSLSCWKCLADIGQKSSPETGQEWIQFTGTWGNPDSLFPPPYGPAFQSWWTGDEPEY